MASGLPPLDIDCLRTFVAIAELNSFTKAAKAVSRTPSAVSMQVKRLEEQLGSTLFVRSSRSVTLTEQGEKLLSNAKMIVMLSNQVVAQFLIPELRGVVKFGVPNDIAERILPSILKRLEAGYPSISVNVVVGNSEDLLARAEQHQLDLALINYRTGSRKRPGELLANEKTVWVGAKGGSAYLRDPLPLALYGEGCIWRTEALKLLDDIDRIYRVAYQSSHAMMQRAAIGADLAIAPLPSSYVMDDMVILGQAEGFSPLSSFEIRLLTGSGDDPAQKVVADLVRSAFKR